MAKLRAVLKPQRNQFIKRDLAAPIAAAGSIQLAVNIRLNYLILGLYEPRSYFFSAAAKGRA